jgi:hypothetical protein
MSSEEEPVYLETGDKLSVTFNYDFDEHFQQENITIAFDGYDIKKQRNDYSLVKQSENKDEGLLITIERGSES